MGARGRMTCLLDTERKAQMENTTGLCKPVIAAVSACCVPAGFWLPHLENELLWEQRVGNECRPEWHG